MKLGCVVVEDGSEFYYSGDCEARYDTGGVRKAHERRAPVELGRIEERGAVWEVVHRDLGDWLLIERRYVAVSIHGAVPQVNELPSRAWGFDSLPEVIEYLSERVSRESAARPYYQLLGALDYRDSDE